MRFIEFMLLSETQTISQFLKNNIKLPQEVVQVIKKLVRENLLYRPFFNNQGRRILEPLVSYITYQMVYYIQGEVKPNIDVESMKWPVNNKVNSFWTNYGDYIVAHVNDGRKMSLFNTVDYTEAQLKKDSDDWHERMALQRSKPGGEGRTILTLDHIGMPGWKWLSLDRGYCSEEAAAAGHCGNAAHREGDNIISLRDPENHVHLTFIVNNKILGESKGRGNNKPSPKYHNAIVELLLSPYINFIRGGGYKPENNFYFKDLDEQQKMKVLAKKPWMNQSYLDYVLRQQKGSLQKKLSQFFAMKDLKVQGRGDGAKIIFQEFDDLSEIEEFLKGMENVKLESGFAWIEDPIDVSVPDEDWDRIDMPNEMRTAIEEYIDKELIENGYDAEQVEEMDFNDKVERDDEIESALRSALYSGYEVGTSNEAWKDIVKQLSSPDDNGYWFDMKHPFTLRITLRNLKDLSEEHGDLIDEGGGDELIRYTIKTDYSPPYYGYSDFSEEEFEDRALEELPKEIRMRYYQLTKDKKTPDYLARYKDAIKRKSKGEAESIADAYKRNFNADLKDLLKKRKK